MPGGTELSAEQARDKLRHLFANLKTASAREDLLHILRHKLLVYAARSMGATKVSAATV